MKMKNKKSIAVDVLHFDPPLTSYKHEHITVIPNQTNLTLCLVCKKTIPNNDENVSIHLCGSKHNKNVVELFKMCTTNNSSCIFESDHMKIILKLKFDWSILLKNEMKYIHRFENLIICLICEDIIAEIKTCNLELKEDICKHLQSEQHLNSIKNNICWVYELEKNSGFLMFHKNLIFCSICNQTYRYGNLKSNILEGALDHLGTIHAKKMNNFSTCEKTNINKQIQVENSDNTFKERSTKHVSGNLYLQKDVSLNYLNCVYLIKSTEKFNSDCSKDSTGNELSIPGFNELICPECKGVVDIYNNDPGFSLDLHLEKHRDLSDVNHLDVEEGKDTEYTCPICCENILIFNKNIKLSISLHECNRIDQTSNEIGTVVNYDTSMIFEHMKGIFKEQSDCVIIDGNDFCCKLCKCTFQLPNCFLDACCKIEAHLTELYHKEQYNMYNNKNNEVNGTFNQSRKNLDPPWDLFYDKNNPNINSLITSVINRNSQYIEKCEIYYICKVCKCCFLYFGIEKDILKTLAEHFLCRNHIKKLNRNLCERIKDNVVDANIAHDNSTCSSSTQILPIKEDDGNHDSTSISSIKSVPIKESKIIYKKLIATPGFQLNSEFLFVQGNTVYCKLCKLSFTCDKINKVRKHCYDETHSKILVENAAKYLKCHENKQLSNGTDPSNEKFIYVLKKLAESHYRQNNPTVTPHLLYISNNGKDFLCILCNTNIQFSMNGMSLVNHFLSTAHKKRIYHSACNDSSVSVGKISKVNEIQWNTAATAENVLVKSCGEERLIKDNKIKNISNEVVTFLENLPQEYCIYRDFISVEGKIITCHLCSISFLSKNSETDCKNLMEHMSSSFHKEQYLLYEEGSSNDTEQNKNNNPWDKFENGNNFKTCVEVQLLNDKNELYLEKGDIYFMCRLCNVYFIYFDLENMRYIFAAHCSTEIHIKNLSKKYRTLKVGNNMKVKNDSKCFLHVDANLLSQHSDGCELKSDIEKLPKKSTLKFVIALNQYYFRIIDNQLHCDICLEFIQISENDRHIKSHCYSQDHSSRLTKYSIYFMESLSEALDNRARKQDKFDNILKKMAKKAYISKTHTIIANLFYIGYNKRQFVCYLCNKTVRFTENGHTVMVHIMSKVHATNVLKLNCIFRSYTSCDNTAFTGTEEKVKENSLEFGKPNCGKITEDKSKMGRDAIDPVNTILTQTFVNSNEMISSMRLNEEGKTLVSMPSSKSSFPSTDEDFSSPSHSTRNDNLDASVKISCLSKPDTECEEDCLEEGSDASDSSDTLSQYDEAFKGSCEGDFSHEISESYEDSIKLGRKSANLTWSLVEIKVHPMSYNSNLDYVCPHCNEVIKIIDENIKLSFESHYKTCHLNIEDVLSANAITSSNKTYLREVLDCLPDSYQEHFKTISVKANTLFCDSCKSFIETEMGNIFESAIQLFFHLSSKFHEEEMSQYVKEKMINLRPTIEPLIHFSAIKTAPEKVKKLFSTIETLSFEKTNAQNQICDKQQTFEKSTFYQTTFTSSTYDESSRESINELKYCKESYNSDLSTHCLTSENHQLSISGVKKSKKLLKSPDDIFMEQQEQNKLNTNLTRNLIFHKEFMSWSYNQVHCKICSKSFKADDVKSHVTDFEHKRGYLIELKNKITPDLRKEVKYLILINNELYCVRCQCFISTQEDFNSNCQTANNHFKNHNM